MGKSCQVTPWKALLHTGPLKQVCTNSTYKMHKQKENVFSISFDFNINHTSFIPCQYKSLK